MDTSDLREHFLSLPCFGQKYLFCCFAIPVGEGGDGEARGAGIMAWLGFG